MLIEIDTESIDELERSEDKKYSDFFNELSYLLYKGINYFYIEKSNLERLYSSNKLENNAREKYLIQFNNSVEDKSIKNSIKNKIVITGNSASEIFKENNQIFIPIDIAIKDINLEQRIRIIAENNNDCAFYKYIGNIYMAEHDINGVNLELESILGGGTSIAMVYKENIVNKNIAILLVDTDIKYAEGEKGRTCNELIEAKKDMMENQFEKITQIISLNVHEIENLIPLKLIKEYYLYHKAKDKIKIVENLEKIYEKYKEDYDERNPIYFYDMKSGITKNEMERDEKYNNYWKKVLDLANIEYNVEQGKLLDGFGRNLLPNINNYVNKIICKDFYGKYLNDELKIEWNNIGELIYNFGCARKRRSV